MIGTNSQPVAIPDLDPIALPAPVWLLYGLLVFTFVLHVVPMSVTLGGGFWAILARWAGREAGLRDLAVRLAKWLPIWTAATVTTGVAALLFLQVLYGHLFYSAAVVIAVPWLSVVGLVIVGYYGYYFRSYRAEKKPAAAFWVGAVAWLLFAFVGFVLTNQMTLMLEPARMHALYAASPSGLSLNLGEPMLWPRYVHMLVGAIALAALWVAWLGVSAVRRGDETTGRRILDFGVRGFLIATLVEIGVGFWFVLVLPGDLWRFIFGGHLAATIYFVASVILTVGGAIVLWRARAAVDPSRKVIMGAVHIVLVVILMILIRDVLRREILGSTVDFGAMATAPQWGTIALFGVLLVAGLGTLGWMVTRVRPVVSHVQRNRSQESEPVAQKDG